MKKPELLSIYQALEGRVTFLEKDARQFFNTEQGYLGEKRLFELLKDDLSPNAIVLHDLLLAYRHNIFQVDFLIILPDEIMILESKYYQGEFEFSNGQLINLNRQRTYQNPLYQLQRANNYLQNLLQDMHIHFTHFELYCLHTSRNDSIYEKEPTYYSTHTNQAIYLT